MYRRSAAAKYFTRLGVDLRFVFVFLVCPTGYIILMDKMSRVNAADRSAAGALRVYASGRVGGENDNDLGPSGVHGIKLASLKSAAVGIADANRPISTDNRPPSVQNYTLVRVQHVVPSVLEDVIIRILSFAIA